MFMPLQIIPICSNCENMEEPNWLILCIVLFIISTFLVILGKMISRGTPYFSIRDIIGGMMKIIGAIGYVTMLLLILIKVGNWLYLLLI